MAFARCRKYSMQLPLTLTISYTSAMPSHVTHWLFAERVSDGLGVEFCRDPEVRPLLVLGSQGPDIFYHNQRRRPSGLSYGSLMHRHGYGTAVSWMWQWAAERALDSRSWAAAWTIGFATHAILDRFTHPFVNYFAGWVVAGDRSTDRYRSMHPFLERLIDVAMLDAQRGCHPRDLDFFSLVDCGSEPSGDWVEMMCHAMSHTYKEAGRDDELRDRLRSAYLDTRGYYEFTNYVDEEYLRQGLLREKKGQVSLRWMSIVHPLWIPADLDVLNASGRRWCHPCDDGEVFESSFDELFGEAAQTAVAALAVILDEWDKPPTEERRMTIASTVGDWNLSDGRNTARPCEKRHSQPLPLAELQDRIRARIGASGSTPAATTPPADGD